MKFTCEKQLLQNAIAISSHAVSSKSTIPELEGLLIEAGENIRVTGYDLKKAIYTKTDAVVTEAGAVVLNARLFGEMVRRMDDGIVTVTADESLNTTVKCGQTEFNFKGMDPDNFPEIPSVDGIRSYTIAQPTMKKMINQTIFAVGDNDSRPVYTGSKFEIEDGILTVVSVDGYRLALRRESIEGGSERTEFIVPGTALSDIERICSTDEEEKIKISVGANHVSFTVGNTVVVTRLLEGDFLNYKKAIPEKFTYKVKVGRGEFLRCVDRVSLIVEDKTKSPVRMAFGDGIIDCTCKTPLGIAQDICTCEGSGSDLVIGFNNKYVIDSLKAAPGDELLFCLNASTSPCVIMPADENESFRYMVLPVRIDAQRR